MQALELYISYMFRYVINPVNFQAQEMSNICIKNLMSIV